MLFDIINAIKEALGEQNNQFLSAGLVLGILTWFGYVLKKVPTFLIDRIGRLCMYSVYIDNSTEMYSAFVRWYYNNYPEKFRRVEFKGEIVHKSLLSEAYQYKDFNFVFYKNRLLFIKKDKRTLEQAHEVEHRSLDTYMISGFFAGKAIQNMLSMALTSYNSK